MDAFTAFDYLALFVVGVSLLIGLLRGAVKEIVALVGWIAAFLVAYLYAAPMAALLERSVASPALRMLAAYAILFFGVLLLSTLLRVMLSELVEVMGLGSLDRLLGSVVGFARGMIIMVVLVLLSGMTDLPKTPLWQGAVSSGWFESLAKALRPWLPEEIRRRIEFDRKV